MPVFRIPSDELVFPHPSLAEAGGLLGVGADLSPERLLLGYANGIFPWYNEGQPILWFSPDPRFVLEPDDLRITRSLRKRVRQGRFEVTMDADFAGVLAGCRAAERPGQEGTWITGEMDEAYNRLHELGWAHSVEVTHEGVLVGGLYGVAVGRLFSGESMFARSPDASKVAFVWAVQQLQQWGFELIDCQVFTAHLARFGAVEIPRAEYLERLPALVEAPSRTGRWSFDPEFGPTV